MVSASSEREYAQIAQYIKQQKLDHLQQFVAQRNIDLDAMVDMTGKTPLMHAASLGNVDILKFIGSKVSDPSVQDCLGRNALHYAAAAKQGDAMEYLAKELDIDSDQQTNGGLTPLMCAVKTGDQAIVAVALNNNVNPFFRDKFGKETTEQIGDQADAIKSLIENAKDQWKQQLGSDLEVLREDEDKPDEEKFGDFQ